jgi:large conductance mechanosensitive channel
MVLNEFKKFILRGNIIDLAIAVIIGAAFGRIVTSLVNDILMPCINPLIPSGDWKTVVIGPGIKLGSFLGTVVDFLIIAFVIFLVVKVINSFKKPGAEAAAVPTKEEILLAEIRDILKKTK